MVSIIFLTIISSKVLFFRNAENWSSNFNKNKFNVIFTINIVLQVLGEVTNYFLSAVV